MSLELVLFLYFFLKHLFLGWAQLPCEFCQGFTGSCESRSEIQFLFLRCLTGRIEISRRCKRHMFTMSFPGGSDNKECAYNAGYLDLIPWRKEWQPTPVFLPGKSHGQRRPSMRSQRVGQGWVTNIFPFILFTMLPNPDCCFLSSLGQGYLGFIYLWPHWETASSHETVVAGPPQYVSSLRH